MSATKILHGAPDTVYDPSSRLCDRNWLLGEDRHPTGVEGVGVVSGLKLGRGKGEEKGGGSDPVRTVIRKGRTQRCG